MRKRVLYSVSLLVCMMMLVMSCSAEPGTDNEYSEDLVDISFTTSKSKALTSTREAFDEADYVWMYSAEKDDETGLTTGETRGSGSSITTEYVVPGGTTVGLKGKTVTSLSQGYWNFTLYAYKAVKDGDTVTGHSDTYSFRGSVTHQKVVKGALTSISVTVVPNTNGNGSIRFSTDIFLNTLTGAEYKQGEQITDVSQLQMRFEVKQYGETESIEESEWSKLKAGTYVVKVEVYDKNDTDFIYASESKVVTVYTGLETVVSGNVGELSSGVEFESVTEEPAQG